MRTKNVLQLKASSEVVFKRLNINSIFRRLLSGTDLSFRRPCQRLFSLLPDSLYLAQIFFIAAELQCNYMILNPITFKLYNLNLLSITKVSTGTHSQVEGICTRETNAQRCY